MKRRNNVIEQVADIDNLRLAVWKAGKGKRYKEEVMAYSEHLDENLLRLQEQIYTGDIDVGSYQYFKIYEPKERAICAAAFKEQVLHHALMNICHEDFERKQIHHSYASRKGKGTHRAIQKASGWTKNNTWYLKLDVKKFFDSIHHQVLKTQMQQMYKDQQLLAILNQIIDSYEAYPKRGVPIGNLTSQYFANHYLSGLDHFIKEKLKVKAFLRYMDDMVLWHDDKGFLLDCQTAIEDFLQRELLCTLKPFQLNRCEKGLPFLGFSIFPNQIRLLQKSKRRYIRKIMDNQTAFHNKEMTEEEAHKRSSTLAEYICQADTKRFRQSLFEKKGLHHRVLTA